MMDMKKKKLSPIESKAKMDVLEKLKKDMQDLMGDNMQSGLKKVTVAAPDEESLGEGLDKARDIIGREHGMGLPTDEESSPEHETMEAVEDEIGEPEEDSHDDEPQTEEECDAKIQELLMKKHALKNKGM